MWFVVGVPILSGLCYWLMFRWLLKIHEAEWMEDNNVR